LGYKNQAGGSFLHLTLEVRKKNLGGKSGDGIYSSRTGKKEKAFANIKPRGCKKRKEQERKEEQ